MILETAPEDLNIIEAMEQDLYYVFSEGLTNITRHAQALRGGYCINAEPKRQYEDLGETTESDSISVKLEAVAG